MQESRNKVLSTFGHLSDNNSTLDLHEKTSPQQPKRMAKWLKRKEHRSNEKVHHCIEYFEAHDYVVTTAIFAPTKTRQHIARTKYDTIYNHTPVQATSRRLSAISSGSQQSLPFFLDEDIYAEGHILITADFRGYIKVWRVDSGIYQHMKTVESSHSSAQTSMDNPSPASLSSSSSTFEYMSPSPKNRKNFGLFHSRHSK